MNANNQIHALWVSGELSPLGELTLRSFLRFHGPVQLWTYDHSMSVPDGVRLHDASEVIPRENLFAYRRGEAAGSFGGFSDLFRTKLLWQHGGWWTDMDVTLVRPIPAEMIESEIVLREHWCNPIVGNLMKFPAGTRAMRVAYERMRHRVNADNTNWNLPIRVLSDTVREHDLLHHRRRIGHLDELVDVVPFVRLPISFPSDWWAMHWCNEMWRRQTGLLRCIHPQSPFSQLLEEYGIPSRRTS